MHQKSATELERFAASFADEDHLRKAVIVLLERMPHVGAVRDTHGNSEIGKDIVFETEGPFGETSLHACVLKNVPITGVVSSALGAREVYFQVEQSLDTPIPRVSDGIPQSITTAWVISPYECQLPATISIAGKLSTNKNRIKFLCGPDLLREFKRRYPEYLMFEAGALGQLAATAISALDSEDPVEDALRLHGMSSLPGTLRAQYIPPHMVKHLDHFSLSLALPRVTEMAESVKKSHAARVAQQLIVTGNLIGALNKRIGSETRCRELSIQLASDVKNAWNKAFRKRRASWQQQFGKLPKEEQPPPLSSTVESVLLEGRSSLDARSARLLREYKRSVVPIEQLLTDANGCADASSQRKRWPSTSALATYCLVEDLS